LSPAKSNLHMNTAHLPAILALCVALGLTACGGGGGGESNASQTAPTAADNSVTQRSVAIPSATYAAGSAELGGWTVLQQARVLCGFGALRQDVNLDKAAQNHARYLASESVATGTHLLSHTEDNPNNPYYKGNLPWDRTVNASQYYGVQVAEILEATYWQYDVAYPPVFPPRQERGATSMRRLLNTVYHLSGALNDGSDVGFGADIQTYANGTQRVEEYRFGSLNGAQNGTLSLDREQPATYPCKDSSNIPPAFVPSDERPNPFPLLDPGVAVGTPIYLKVDTGQTLTLTSHSISTANVAVTTTVLTHTNDPARDAQGQPYIDVNEVFVVPNAPLQANTSYQVALSGTINGRSFTRNFTMITGQ